MRNTTFWAIAPTPHHLVVDFGPAFCPDLNRVFSGHSDGASWATPAACRLVLVEGNEVKVRIIDVVARFVVDCKDIPSLSMRQFFSKAVCDC